MFSRTKLLSATLSLAALTYPAFAQELQNEGPVPTTALIAVQSKSDTPLAASALKLEVDGRATPVTSVVPIRNQGVQLAILIDDGLRGSFGLQVKELQDFVKSLPPNVQVLVGYMQNGTVRQQGGFSNDRSTVANNLRIPLSSPGVSASPYFCLSDFVKHWPGNTNAARVVLMLTNGVDPYNGSVSPMNQDSPYVQTAQNDAQRAGVAVYSIYYGDRGMRGGLASFSGQSYLQQVADATGGQSLYQGRLTPPSISPYLDQFKRALAESYLVTFNANASHEGRNTLKAIKFRTTQSGIKIHAPQAVHPGLAERASE